MHICCRHKLLLKKKNKKTTSSEQHSTYYFNYTILTSKCNSESLSKTDSPNIPKAIKGKSNNVSRNTKTAQTEEA